MVKIPVDYNFVSMVPMYEIDRLEIINVEEVFVLVDLYSFDRMLTVQFDIIVVVTFEKNVSMVIIHWHTLLSMIPMIVLITIR